MLKLLVFVLALMPTLSVSNTITVLINHDDGGKKSQRHLKRFLNVLKQKGCDAIPYQNTAQPAQLLFDPTPRSIALKDHPDYQLIAIAKTLDNDTYIKGAIVVKASIGIKDLNSLKGYWFAFINKHSWPGYMLPSKLLNDVNINEENSHFYFVGNYIGSAAALGHQDVQVAIIAHPLATRWADLNDYSIVAVTEAVETGGWWIHKNISSSIRQQCTRALTQLNRSEHKVVPAWIDGFKKVNDKGQ
ncbi:phosphate/phosphite/phosphonate ABC transporter substrate-binding protein [Thalassotalea piscium]|uniref:ABC-type phosphate/phosphonate transport system substrate-binding protein n=1 Tax=Thalassotalea piscium TaxID=1230533 RepID=A0A7X0TTX6_9GAMM|nr:PhnD/SsuA/transferrin family substrate-binding protein [Thalassotalea piscium]MBB6543737.1 ABC-type phosphate/phosphonate transport system substrate-binding protein [Thalassotalea piscium]